MRDIDKSTLPAVYVLMMNTENLIAELVGKPVKLSLTYTTGSFHPLQLKIINLINEFFRVSWEQILSDSRKQEIAEARHVYCYMMMTFSNFKEYEIGKQINRDRTSVLHGLEKVRGYIKHHDPKLVPVLDNLLKKFNENKVEA
jgi:chromosomal replication initiation ATPase DnaA